MPDDNMTMLQTVVKGLEELKDEVVFVGGVVAQMYATDPAATEIRPTKDVDCVIEFSSRLKFNQLEARLRTKGFANDMSAGAPICCTVSVWRALGQAYSLVSLGLCVGFLSDLPMCMTAKGGLICYFTFVFINSVNVTENGNAEPRPCLYLSSNVISHS